MGHYPEPAPTTRMRADYAALFAAGGACRYRGESSTKYTKAPTFSDVPERLHAACPDAHILYMIREPVARIVSQYLFNRRVHGETRPLRAAVAADPRYRAYGDYATQIAPYRALFGKVLVLQAEALAADPQQVMDRVFDWLDLSRLQVVQEEKRNRSADAVRKHEGATRLLIRPELEPLRRLVKRIGAKRLVQRVWDRLNPPAPLPVTEAERAGLTADLADWRQAQARAIAPMLDGARLEWESP